MAPTTTRSSSISSASTSTSTSKSSADGIKKKFACSYPSCGKSFSRSEHLHRHALNHKDGNNTCLRCMAHFRRRDLLDRHMARHKEKDDEAGGEGLGILATRKRLWRDVDGNIVNARRPSYVQDGAKRRQLGTPGSDRKSSSASHTSSTSASSVSSPRNKPNTPMSRAWSTASSTIVVDTGADAAPGYPSKAEEAQPLAPDAWLEMGALPSPPISEQSTASHSDSISDDASELDALYEDTWPITLNGLPQIINDSPVLGRTSEYPASPSWGPQPFQTFMGATAETLSLSPYDDVFKPERELREFGIYGWQEWSSNVVMSRCREEKVDAFGEQRERERRDIYGERWARGFGLGTA